MKKSERERIVRGLAREWLKTQPTAAHSHPSFRDFSFWLKEHQPTVLQFKSAMGPLEDAERWFDSEFRQSWRN